MKHCARVAEWLGAARPGTAAESVTVIEITAFRSAGTRPELSACDMWLSRNNPLKKITDPFAALSAWGFYVRLRI